MADVKDVEQVAQELQRKFDDFKEKNDKRIDAIEQETEEKCGCSHAAFKASGGNYLGCPHSRTEPANRKQ